MLCTETLSCGQPQVMDMFRKPGLQRSSTKRDVAAGREKSLPRCCASLMPSSASPHQNATITPTFTRFAVCALMLSFGPASLVWDGANAPYSWHRRTDARPEGQAAMPLEVLNKPASSPMPSSPS